MNTSEQFKDLSEESQKLIQEAVDAKVQEKVQIHVERALAEQDELYSSKLEKLLEALDKDHTAKLEKVVSAIDADRARKLKSVVEKYEKQSNKDAKKFKKKLVESISDYLDAYLKEVVPVADIQEAVKNKKALALLENLRTTLAIDSAIEKKSIKSAIIDGQNQINEASKKLESITSENKTLKESLAKTQADLLVEQKTAALSEDQRAYIKKAMKGKSLSFINENFDYTVKLLEKNTADRLEYLKEEALTDREDVDHVITENTDGETETSSTVNPYLSELGRY